MCAHMRGTLNESDLFFFRLTPDQNVHIGIHIPPSHALGLLLPRTWSQTCRLGPGRNRTGIHHFCPPLPCLTKRDLRWQHPKRPAPSHRTLRGIILFLGSSRTDRREMLRSQSLRQAVAYTPPQAKTGSKVSLLSKVLINKVLGVSPPFCCSQRSRIEKRTGHWELPHSCPEVTRELTNQKESCPLLLQAFLWDPPL